MADFEDSAYFADTQSAIQDLQEQSSGPTENPSDEDKSEINFYAYDSRAGIAEDAIVEFKELAASFYGSDDESTSENPKDSINDQFESSAYGSSPIEPISRCVKRYFSISYRKLAGKSKRSGLIHIIMQFKVRIMAVSLNQQA